jgi:hypothetical protein
MKVTYFSDAASVEMATSYGTLKTRTLVIEFDFRGPETDQAFYKIWQLFGDYGFDTGGDLIESRMEPGIRRWTFSQKWWDRSKRKMA